MQHKVLLADDSPTIQKLVEMALSDTNFQLLSVSDGEQAVEQLEQFDPDIILVDAIMPKMDGYEVCQFVRNSSKYKDTPVILLTGRFQPFDKERADQVGITEKVVKPFVQDFLINLMTGLLPEPVAEVEEEPEEAEFLDDFGSDGFDDGGSDGFDDGATIAIGPEQLRAQLQNYDHLTHSQEEEIPSIDDFNLADEDDADLSADEPVPVADEPSFEENATIAIDPNAFHEEPIELKTEDLDALDLEDVEDLEDGHDEVEDFGDFAADSELEAEEAVSFEEESLASPDLSGFEEEVGDFAEELPVASNLESTESLDISLEELPEQEDEALGNDFEHFEEDTEPLSLASDFEEEEELDELQLEDPDLHDESLEELNEEDFHFEEEEAPMPRSTSEDTQPIQADAALPQATMSDDSWGEELPLPDEVGELELELEDETDYHPSAKSDENAVLEIEDPEDDFSFDEPDHLSDTVSMSEPFSAEPNAFDSEPVPAQADESAPSSAGNYNETAEIPLLPDEIEELQLDTEEDELDLHNDDELSFDEASEFPDSDEEPESGFESMDHIAETSDTDSDFLEDSHTIPVPSFNPPPQITEETDDELVFDDSLEDENPLEEALREDHEDELAATIRVDEPLIQPEEAAYFADTVRSSEPLVTREPEPITAAVSAPIPASPAANQPAGAPIGLDDAQMDILAGKVVNELLKRLGTEEIRDIVWQVVPELAEAMIKKRIYQLEQSVEAE